MPANKAKVPEYPRPVSPVSAQEYPICNDTVIYYDTSDDIDDTSVERAAKRRRIESYATSYLRGEPLFILSAQLKGPFTNGWQNPWSKRKSTGDVHDTARLEVLETIAKASPRPRNDSTKASRPQKMSIDASNVAKQTLRRKSPTPIARKIAPPRSSPLHIPASDVHGPEVDVVLPQNRKVEEWLKTNKSYEELNTIQSQSSPTPANTKANLQTKNWESPMINVEFPPVLSDIVDVVGLLAPPKFSDEEELKTPPGFGQARQKIKKQRDEAPVPADHVAYEQETTTVNGLPKDVSSLVDTSGIEFVNISDKRRSLHTVPPSSHLPAFEYRRVATSKMVSADPKPLPSKTALPNLAGAALDMLQVQRDPGLPVMPLAAHKGDDVEVLVRPAAMENEPPLPKESSTDTATHGLPSAQIAPQPLLQSRISNLSSHGETLLELHQPRAQDSHIPALNDVPALQESATNLITKISTKEPTEVAAAPIEPSASIDMSVPLQKHTEETPKMDMTNQFNTQQMVNSITPFALSTVKKKAGDVAIKQTPTTATKSRHSNKKKRASFAPEEGSSASPHGSIKMTMKVAKSSIGGVANGKAFPEPVIEDGILNDEGSFSATSSGEKKEISKAGESVPGILKLSGPVLMGVLKSSDQNASSSTKHDAQKVNHLSMVQDETDLNDDTFDVDAAIDDLGSFLGTWDAEMEAAGLQPLRG